MNLLRKTFQLHRPQFLPTKISTRIPLMMFVRLNSTKQTTQDWFESHTEDTKKRIRFIQNELTLLSAESKKVPNINHVEKEEYESMLEMSQNRRRKYYAFLYTKKQTKSNYSIKKLIRQQLLQEGLSIKKETTSLSEHPIQYGLGKNALLIKIYRRTIKKWRYIRALQLRNLNYPSIVFDCGFQETMSKYELHDTARQIRDSIAANHANRMPFVLHFCNLKQNTIFWKILQNVMRNVEKLPIVIHENDIVDTFQRDKLIYLSPHAEEVMHTYDPTATYVVGCIVDKVEQKPLSLAKSKMLNIRCQRFPIDQLMRVRSHRSLTLDQVTNILLEIKATQDWPRSLNYVPIRKRFN